MKLVLCELRKLCASRAVAAFGVLLLTLNFALTLYTARPTPVEAAAREVYGIYLDDPEALIEYQSRLEADFFEHLRDDEFEMPSTFAEGVDDNSVLNRVFSRAEYIENYRAETVKLADSAERRARDLVYFGYYEDSFFIREQQNLARIYADLADALDGANGYAYGYDVYFENSRVLLFILIWLIFAVSFIFRNDRVCGFGSIMRTARCGRFDSAMAKIAATLIIGVISTLLFLAADFLAVGMAQGGFSSVTAPIQLFPNYAKVPFQVSVIGYITLQTVYRILAAVLFALFVALVASLGFNYVFCFGISSLIAAANYFLFSREYIGTAPPIKYLNIASAAEGVELFAFHRDLNLFGYPISYTSFFCLIAAASIIILSAVCAFFCCKSIKMPSVDSKKFLPKIGKKESKYELRIRPLLPIWVYELKKNRFLPLSVLAVLLLAAHCAFVFSSVGSGTAYGEAVYYSYISDIKEMSSEERRLYLAEERTGIESALSDYKPRSASFEAGEISYEEYASFLEEYYKSKELERVLTRVEDYSDYADRKGCGIIYNTGYEEFFSIGTDWFLFAALVVLSVGIFAVEYQSGNCAQIVRTAKKGRKNTFFSKILPYSVLGALLGGAFRTSGFIVTACNYELADFDAELCSIRAFEAVPIGISIGSYLIIDLISSVFAGALIACTVCLISCLFKKMLYSLGAVGVALAFPALLITNDIALVSLTAPNRAFCNARGSAAVLALIILLHLLTVTAVAFISARCFCGEKKKL